MLLKIHPARCLTPDFIIIGGGSAGLACARALASSSVVLLDRARPSPTRGTSFGLGGTCVNVGCVPKKLMHYSGRLGIALREDASAFGWEQTSSRRFAWKRLRESVQGHVHMLNFVYSSALPGNVDYVDATARFVDERSVKVVEQDGREFVLRANKAVIVACGGRPVVPENVENATRLGITSDDLFSLEDEPGKTLVVGAGYIGLESASFLQALGFDTTLVVRSTPLKSTEFDRDCAEKVIMLMENLGVKVLRNDGLVALNDAEENQIQVKFQNAPMETFNTVLFATGRRPEISRLNIPSHVQVSKNEKIVVDEVSFRAIGSKYIFAIGDCAETGSSELTPVAIRQGELAAKRIIRAANGENDHLAYTSLKKFVPSTVFTLPSEYSRAGLSEEMAKREFGDANVESYVREWQPLESVMSHVESPPRSFVKLICRKDDDDRVVGVHLVAPNAGETIHGLALACSLGATKRDFDQRVLGVHPTDAEGLTDISVTKSSGLPYVVASGCGGGKCG